MKAPRLLSVIYKADTYEFGVLTNYGRFNVFADYPELKSDLSKVQEKVELLYRLDDSDEEFNVQNRHYDGIFLNLLINSNENEQ